jgi:hypothetical protein
MKSDNKKVFDYLHQKGILKIYRNLNKIYGTTNDSKLKSKLKSVIDQIAIPLSATKKPKKELIAKGTLKLTEKPYCDLLNYVTQLR